MTTTASLLRAILEDPAADDLRLIYADWLTDHGEPERGEFIRVQVAMEQSPYAENVRARDYDARDGISPEWQALFDLHARHKVLFNFANLEAWGAHRWQRNTDSITEFARMPDDIAAALWLRGFVAEFRCPLRYWEQHGPTLLAAHPIEAVVLTDREPRVREAISEDPPGLIISGCEWFFMDGYINRRPQAESIPRDFWVLMGGRDSDGSMKHSLHYPVEFEAHAALNLAALNWARSQVEPPLPLLKPRVANDHRR